MRFELAGPADEPALRRLLRESPVPGAVRVGYECEPDYFAAAAAQGDAHQVLVAREPGSGRIRGMGGRVLLDGWVNGAPARLGYLCQLRLDDAARGSGATVREGYRLLARLHADGAAPFYLTTIIADNRAARRLLEAGLEDFPTYRPLEEFVTLLLPARRARRRADPPVRRAAEGDLERIAAAHARHAPRFQFAPAWTAPALRHPARARGLRAADFRMVGAGDGIAGCLALWDQRSFRQAVVRGYAGALRWTRPLVNLAAPALGLPRLPAPGGALRGAFVSHLALVDDDPRVLGALLDDALADAAERGLDYLILGLARRHPLLAAVRREYPHREYVSVLYAVHWADGAAAVAALDGRVPHLEAALL